MIKKYEGFQGYEVTDLDIAQDSTKFFAVGGDKKAQVVDVTTGNTIRKFIGHEKRISCCELIGEDQLFVTGSHDCSMRLWDVRDRGNRACQMLEDATDSITSLCSFSTGTCPEILCGSLDGRLRRYDIRFGKVILDHLVDPVSDVSLSQDKNCILVSTLAHRILLLEKDTGDELQRYEGHTNSEFRIASRLDTGDSYIVSGSEDSKLYAWELVSGEIVNKMVVDDDLLEAQGQLLTLSSKDDMFIAGGNDGVIRIFKSS